MLRGGHQPGARVVRYARRGPALERRDERVMSQVLRHTYVAHHPRERGDQLRRLDPPDGVDRLMGLGCRHRFRSFCATRALTSFRTSAAGRGLSAVKRMVPLDVSYDASSCLVSSNRPSVTTRLPSRTRTLVAVEVGSSGAAARYCPAALSWCASCADSR